MNPSTLPVLLAAALALAPAGTAAASEWAPAERIVLVTHASPGNSIDLFLRTIADIWTRRKMVPAGVSVENIQGGGGDKARRHVAIQNKGNNHMLFGFTPQMLIAPIRMRSEIGAATFTSIAILTDEPTVLFVNAQSPFRTVRDLIEAARQKPRGILQGGGQFGGPTSLMGRMMSEEAKVEFAYTPFKTSGESIVALLGNHVHFVLEQVSEAEDHVKAGKLRILAASRPIATHPDVPGFASQGMKFRQLSRFRGVMAPPGVAPEAAAHYIRLLERTRATPEWQEYVRRFALTEQWRSGTELAAFLSDEEGVYRKLMLELGLMKGN
ncbi:MAG: tripartite tricarboxylate transporter substrate binding protein [Burkholderiales bacterium]|nr:tripartite tricarboxylate transporter substrate binding protein [Burkholderiales bacterium]